MDTPPPEPVLEVIGAVDWGRVETDLGEQGFALLPRALLDAGQCQALAAGFDDDARYRSSVDMAAHRFGEGVYRYYRRPLPAVVAGLRSAAYPPLAAIANRWAEALGDDDRFPTDLGEFLGRCHQLGQDRPTPLILRYRAGGWNALHQDIYGPLAFPLQLVVALSRPGVDFTGGENLFVEQRPRAQSRGSSVSLTQGHAVIFATRHRPVAGSRGVHRVTMRHGLSTVTSGERCSLGLIFHDGA